MDLVIIFAFIMSAVLMMAMYRFGYLEDKIRYNNPVQAKGLCSKVISKVEKDFLSLGGECNSEFYENPEIVSNINKMAENNVNIRFLFGPNFDIESIDLLRLRLANKIKMRRLKKRYIGDHFKIADAKFVYVAKEHDALDEDRKGYILSSFRDASEKKILFEKLWRDAEEVDVEKMVCNASQFPDEFLKDEWIREHEAKWGTQSGFIKKTQNSEKRPASA